VVQSVDRAFSLLTAIGSEPATLTDLARRVNLPLSTTSRLLSTLEMLGAVERLEANGKFRIGPAIVQMASSIDSSSSLSVVANPVLRELMEEVGEAAGLSVPAGYTMHYIDQVDSAKAVQVQDWVGTRMPMHLVSSGLVMLAHWPTEAIDNFLGRELQAKTPQSVTDPSQIRERLQGVRELGAVWTIEELEVGISSVAAPVLNRSGEAVAAIHLHGPSFRFPSTDRANVEQMLKLAASRLSEFLGPS
jgi:IclR family KDG regulon transcriptional repressor